MKINALTTDMDFRIIPSVIPLQSPSPDRKSLNLITPTKSPNTLDIKKTTTPSKIVSVQKQNAYKSMQEMETQYKYSNFSSSHTPTNISALKQKDQIIKNLRNLIDMITENSRYKQVTGQEQLQLKNQVKILTIQNQKLVNIIDKISKNNKFNQQKQILNATRQQYEIKIDQLTKTMKENQLFYVQQTKQLKKFNKNLNSQFKAIQNEKHDLQLQNKKLIKLLQQKNDVQGRYKQKTRGMQGSHESLQEKLNISTSNRSQQKLSLIKIKQQHSQNLKMLKQGLIKQIQQTFDTMKIALQGMNIKILSLAKRLQSIQKISWQRAKKTHIQRQSITISIRQSRNTDQQQPLTDRSYKVEKKNNSEIYIQEGASSSHQLASRDQFTRLQQIPSQNNLQNLTVQQLKTAKAELLQLRFKYDKLCLDTSSVAFSQRANDSQQINSRYQELAIQTEKKQRQIEILYDQIKNIELQKQKQLDQQSYRIQMLTQQLNQYRSKQQQQQINVKQTQQKIKLLVQNYQKQLEILRKQILISSRRQEEPASKIQNSHESQFEAAVAKIEQLERDKKQISSVLRRTQQQLQTTIKISQQAHKTLKQRSKQVEQQNQLQRLQIEKYQQRVLILTSEISQNKVYIQSLKLELSNKQQQIQSVRNSQQQAIINYKNSCAENQKLAKDILNKQQQINRLHKLINQLSFHSLIQEIQNLKHIINQRTQEVEKYKLSLSEDVTNIQQTKRQKNEIKQLNQQLLQKYKQIASLKARIMQLQNIAQILTQKLRQQQIRLQKSMMKQQSYERQLQQYKSKANQQYKLIQSDTISLAECSKKIDRLKQLQQSRLNQISKYFQARQRQADQNSKL